MDINTISDFRKAMRHGPYAWPGGYPVYFIMEDGDCLSFKAARENRRTLLDAIAEWRDNPRVRSGWRPVALEINYEDDLTCCHTGEQIESAYGVEPVAD